MRKMDVEAIYSTIRDKKGEKLLTHSFNINILDNNGNSLLHLAAKSNDIETSKELMNRGAIYNIKNKEGKTPCHVAHRDELKNLYRNITMFFKAVKKSNFDKVSKYVMDEKYLVNVKEANAGTALHWAVSKNNKDITKLLLENGANVLQLTDKGNTALHTAVHGGNPETIELLLKGVSEEKLSEFVNFQTFETKSTCLHFSAEAGNFQIVKILLKHGAMYNIQNKGGDIPCELTRNYDVQTLLKLINELFCSAKNGDSKPFTELNYTNLSEIEAVMNVRDISNNTILQVLESCGHSDLADTILTFTQKDRKINNNRHKKDEKLSTDSVDVNAKDVDGNRLLHLAAISNDVEISKELMNKGAIYNIKNNDGNTPLHVANGDEVKSLYRSVRMFFKAVKKHRLDKVSKYIIEEKFLVNVKEENAGTALHWAVSKNNKDIAKLLLENGADVLQLTSEGNTALHTAVQRDNVETVELLLKGVSGEKLSEFVNFQTVETKSTCLHISAQNGNFEIVKILLKHGAIYNIQNNTGEIPCTIARNSIIKTFLKAIGEFFSSAKNGDSKPFTDLTSMNFSELEAVMNVRDNSNNTILQVLESCGHSDLADTILKTFSQKNRKIPEWSLSELEMLEYSANVYCSCSKTYIELLDTYSRPSTSEKNTWPWKTLKEGSYLLRNAYTLVSDYKSIRRGPIEDANINIIDETLQILEFNPIHISSGYTQDAYEGKTQCFVSKAKGTEYYYKLLHSDLVKDVRFFIEMVVKNISAPTENFLASLKEKFLFFPTRRLKAVIENNSESEVLKCIAKGADVNCVYYGGETPLVCAVKCGFLKILEILLENGADVHQILDEEDTVLHIAVSNTPVFKASKPNSPLELTLCLLKYGAKYNCKNKEGKSPLNVSKFVDTTSLLRKVHDCFSFSKNDNPASIRWLQLMKNDEFQAITQSQNADGYTLLQLAVSQGHKSIEKAILEILPSKLSFTDGSNDIQRANVTEDMFERKVDKLKNLSEKYVHASKKHLPELMVLADEGDSKINCCPWKTLMEGCYYLVNTYNLVHEYKSTLPILHEDANIERMHNMLNKLQFYPEHIASFYGDAKDNGHDFVCKAEGTELYYRLLNGKYKKSIRQFLEMTEENIDIPAKMFIDRLFRMKRCTIL